MGRRLGEPNDGKPENVPRSISQQALFSEFEEPITVPEGLLYGAGFLTEREETELSIWIAAQPWDTRFSRRRQFYGGSYDREDAQREMPSELMSLGERLQQEGFLFEVPDRILINEYLPGQGIAAHVDYHPDFGDQVAMLSLLDSYPMRFARDTQVFEQWLERRSLCVISGECRYEWTHEIARRQSDPLLGGGRRNRGRRLSITFRKRK